MRNRLLSLAWTIALGVMLGQAAAVRADLTGSANGHVTIGVGDTAMTITGKTSPNAFVTIADFGQVIGTTVSGLDGYFSANFPAQQPDIHKPSVFARDSDGLYGETVLIATSLYPHFTTDVDFFLPPTLALASNSLPRGQGLVLGGRAFPDSVIVVTVDNSESFEIVVASDGNWSFELPTSDLSMGTHSLFAVNRTALGEQSAATRKQLFTVTRPTSVAPTPTPAPGSTPTPRPVYTPRPQSSQPTPISVHTEPPLVLVPVSESRIPVTIAEGTGPYTVRVDWGDGGIEEIILDGNSVPLKHRYLKPGSYDVYIYVGDSTGAYKDTKIVLRVTSISSLIFDIIQLLLLFIFIIMLLEGIHRRHLRYAY